MKKNKTEYNRRWISYLDSFINSCECKRVMFYKDKLEPKSIKQSS
jgi:hypothetical protein